MRARPGTPEMFLAGLALLLSAGVAAAVTDRDRDVLLGGFNTAFYVQEGTSGYLKDNQAGGVSYFWTQAEMIESVIDAYEWTGDPAYLAQSTNLLNGFLLHNGNNWSWNIYNDDIMWAVLAFARVSQHTGLMDYAAVAKANFDLCYARAWDTTFGGGLWWTTDNDYKNAAVNGPGSIAAYLMYEIYGDAVYLTKSQEIFNWEKTTLLSSLGSIADGYNAGGVWGGATTYNQGTFIGAAHLLGYTNDAALVANYTMMNMTRGGVLPEYGMANNNSGFNAIFLRWLTRFMNDRNLQSRYQPWLQINARAAWEGRRADNLSWCNWNQSTPKGVNFFSWDCIASFSVLAAADSTQNLSPLPVPGAPISHWSLEETDGTIAADASGNTNDGAVNNPLWNSAGRVNGCLTFNGVNTDVEVGNPLANDFSIVFWVNTTQSSGGPQWYNGAGLVDGDVPFNNNDFGTALVNGKFALGVGNPDVTLLSSTSINDGNWHQCVATRSQATGTLRVYVDGVLENTGVGTRNTLNAAPTLRLGSIASGGHYFNGRLDEVRLFSRTLTTNEVAALFQSRTAAPTTAPMHLVAVPGNGRVELEWGDAAGATGYVVKRSLLSGGPYDSLTNVSSRQFTDTTVLNNRTYHYVVSGMNDEGEGADSLEATANPMSLAVWYKADSLTSLGSGTAVSTWADLSGRGQHAVQNLSAHRPTYITNAVNGRPAVRFDAGSEAYLWLYRPVQDDFTIMIVFQSTQGLGTGSQFYEGAGLVSGEVSGTVNDFGVGLNASGRVLAGVGNPDTSIQSGPGYNDGQPHIATIKRIQNTGSIRLYLDGVQISATTTGTASLTAPNVLVLGAQAVLNNYLSGDIAEVRIYDAALSDIDRFFVERALKCSYGLPGGATPTAPTGLTGLTGNRQVSLHWNLLAGADGYDLWRSTNGGATYALLATGLTNSSCIDATAVSGQENLYRVSAKNDCGPGLQSGPISVFLSLPALSLRVGQTAAEVQWPDWANDWSLYSATNLVPPVNWVQVTNGAVASNGFLQVTLPLTTEQTFFRLAAPAN